MSVPSDEVVAEEEACVSSGKGGGGGPGLKSEFLDGTSVNV